MFLLNDQPCATAPCEQPAQGEAYDLTAVLGAAAGDGGIPHGRVLVEFAEAVVGGDDGRLARARTTLAEALGAGGLVDAAAVVANFNAIDRIADATGIPIDAERVELTAGLRAELGIDAFAEGRM